MLPHAAIVALLISSLTVTKVYSIVTPDVPFWTVLAPVTAVQLSVMTAILFVGMALASALPFAGWKHYLAIIAGGAVATWIGNLPLLQFEGYPWDAALRFHITESGDVAEAYFTWTMMSTCLLMVVFYSALDREARIARASRDAEVERALAQRAVVESRLRVMQARIEPEFLFDALADARRLYERSPPAADKLLDDLILYLRAALPQMRGAASTLGGEVVLSEAYLAIVPAVRDGRLRLRVSIDPDVAALPFPPMVLLPLTQGVATPDAQFVALEAHRDGGDMWIAFRTDAARAPAEWSDEKLAELHRTLAQFHGEAVRIGRHARDGGWVVEICVPAAATAAAQPGRK